MIDHSMFLRVLEQLYQYAVLCESKIWEFSKEMIALVFLLVQVVRFSSIFSLQNFFFNFLTFDYTRCYLRDVVWMVVDCYEID